MPGIAGIISKMQSSQKKRQDLQTMLDCMMHEKFYNSGIYVNDALGVYVGWTTHAGSFSDCMPIYHGKKDRVLVFSGENFPHTEDKVQLRSKGYELEFNSARYLVHLYKEDETDFLKRLNGWFSGILIDLRAKKSILFNDRYSMQRIYYYETENDFFFSSEAKALLKICPEVRKINPAAAGEFLACGCTLENKTLFSGINIVPGGSAWIFDQGGNIQKKKYFDYSTWENQSILKKEIFYNKFREAFQSIIPKYFQSREPVAMSLTGGLDTRMIMAFLRQEPGQLPCYTFGGMFRECFDAKIARRIAVDCQQPYSLFRLDKSFLKDFSQHAERTIYITDGCVDIGVSHEIYLTRMARDIAPVRMTGNYGSEVLRSVNYIKASPPVDELIHQDFKKHIQRAVNIYSSTLHGNQLTYAVTKLIPWHLYGRLTAAQSQLTVRAPYMDNDIVGLLYQAPDDVRRSNAMSRRLIQERNPELSRIMTDRGVSIGAGTPLSIIVRFYREVLFKAEYFYNEGMPDWMTGFDRIMRPLHPEKVMLGNHKIEYYRHWFCNELADYMRNIIIDDLTLSRPYWNKQFLIGMVDDHIKGKRNHIREINKVLAIELIHRTLLENI